MTCFIRHISSAQKLQRAVAFLCIGFFSLTAVQAQTPTAANQVKAVFLFNFTQFVSWPSFALGANDSPFVIGVLGTDPFGAYLDKVVEGERVGNHPIVVQRYADVKEVKACHILFINQNRPADVIRDLGNQSILTVSDSDGFAYEGGMVRFYVENNRIRLQINEKAAKAAGLTISSKLLRLASVISREP